MKIIVATLTHNNLDIIPFWLRHYALFADEIAVWDDNSTDGTKQILAAHPKVMLRDWPHASGIQEDVFLAHWYAVYPTAAEHGFDWMMLPDSDEFIYAPNVRAVLEAEKAIGTEVIQTQGFNMTGNGMPPDDGRQIWEILKTGVGSGVYSKPVVFNPAAKVQWVRGRHALENCSPKMSDGPKLKLLHYRYLGGDYTKKRNAKNYDRVGADKGAAWSCAPDYDGEHSAKWAESIKHNQTIVV